MTRSEFLRGLLGLTAFSVACAGDDGGGGGTGGSCSSVDVDIADNHSHVLSVPAADVVAGAAMTYDLTAGNGHTHQVTVSGPNMEKLAMGEVVEVLSTTDAGHQHMITLMC